MLLLPVPVASQTVNGVGLAKFVMLGRGGSSSASFTTCAKNAKVRLTECHEQPEHNEM